MSQRPLSPPAEGLSLPDPPGWADPKMASVTDPWWATLARKAAGAVMPDPNRQPDVTDFDLSGATHLVSPLVSIYRDKAAREAAGSFGVAGTLSDLYKALVQRFGPNIAEAAQQFSARYPRIAANSKILHTLDPEFVAREGHIDPSVLGMTSLQKTGPRVKEPIPIGISDAGIADAARSMGRARSLLGEEGLHVAQGLGDIETYPVYGATNRLVGYEPNPYEVRAKARAAAFAAYPDLTMPQVRQLRRPPAEVRQSTGSVLSALDQIASWYPEIDPARATTRSVPQVADISTIQQYVKKKKKTP